MYLGLKVNKAFMCAGLFQGHLVELNETAGTLPSDHVLELRGLDRTHQGDYACAAGNVEGDTLSEPLRLKIQCKQNLSSLFKSTILFTIDSSFPKVFMKVSESFRQVLVDSSISCVY